MQVLTPSILVLLAVQQCLSQGLLSALKKGVKLIQHEVVRDVNDAANPVIQGAFATVGTQCALLKKGLGLDYNSTTGDRAPDVDELPIVYTTRDIQVSIPLRAVITELPRILGSEPANIVLKIFAHGFTDSPSKSNFKAVNDAYRSVGGVDVLAVDASSLIDHCYLCSSTNVVHIGKRLGEALAELYKVGLLPENIHLVGHSLGAHICGFAAKEFTELTGRKVGRVTGLDPAGPCFVELDDTLRLKSTDAEFVDVIHSNAGVFGINEKVGQVDFYPNGGAQQPDCLIETCSHGFAVKLYVDSILDPMSFPSVACSSYDDFTEGKCQSDVTNYMGEGAVPCDEGRFYLQTKGKSPFSKGTNGTSYVNTDGVVRTVQSSIVHLFRG